MKANPHYRPDLQGLRALAVALVFCAHASVPNIAGGFIGVDVFFVLSGYLISGLLAREYLRTGRIAIGSFYAHRLRRLLPAMLLMIGITSATAAWLLSEREAYSMLASTPFAASWTSNLFFAFRELDYFNELNSQDLFLHTWSLGVEEQFYLIWPFVLGGLLWLSAYRSSSQRTVGLLAGITVLGAAGCIAWTHLAPIQAFYLTPARIWQFALGALAYFLTANNSTPLRHTQSARILLGTGLIMIFASALLFDAHMSYPGVRAIPPSLGAALIIIAGDALSRSGRGNPLSDARLVWIGDRSYSIYLWHWPALILGSALGLGHSATETIALLLLTLLLAMYSYRFVELPFWKGRFSNITPRRVLLGGMAVTCLAFASALQILKAPPFSEMQAQDIARAIRSDLPEIYRLGCDAWYEHARLEPCIFDGGTARYTAVFIGDSIGAQWFSAFPDLFPPPNWRIVVLTKSACPIVDEDIFYKRIGAIYTVCTRWRNAALEYIARMQPDVVLVGSSNSAALDATQWVEGSRRIFERIANSSKQVFVFGGTPQLGIDGPDCIARALDNPSQPLHLTCRGRSVAPLVGETLDHLKEAARSFDNIMVLDLTATVCPDNVCSAVTKDGIPVFRDSQHLTNHFVRTHAETLRAAMAIEAGP